MATILLMMFAAMCAAMCLNFAGGYGLRDANLKATKALPNGQANVVSTGMSIGETIKADLVAGVEFLLTAPALTVAQLGNADTMTYDVLISPNANMSNPVTVNAAVIVQTGANGAGAVAATYRFRLPSNIGASGTYLAIKATNSSAKDTSAASLTLEALL